MPEPQASDRFNVALDNCAAEPIHIPGTVQDFGCLLAVDPVTSDIRYASENTHTYMDWPVEDVLGRPLRNLVGSDIWHDICNMVAAIQPGTMVPTAKTVELNGQSRTLSVSPSDDLYIVEIEPDQDAGLLQATTLKTLTFLVQRVQSCRDEASLHKETAKLLRNLSGYDRVMVYRFDKAFNGEVLAEDKIRAIPSFLGLRFPHWDIPAQARDMMRRMAIRIIADVKKTPVPLLSEKRSSPPLDISPSVMRGTSPVHMEYLANMGISATMTLSVNVSGQLWGIISFHHQSPKTPPPLLRAMLANFGEFFAAKVQTLKYDEQVALLTRADDLFEETIAQTDTGKGIEQVLPSIAPKIMDIMDAHGVAALTAQRAFEHGQVPGRPLLDRLLELGNTKRGEVLAFENLADDFPDLAKHTNGCAGALVAGTTPNRAICIFRQEQARRVNWAGEPSKKVETSGDSIRLSPRGSFATYLELIRGHCKPWSDKDLQFARRIVRGAERRALDTLSRQQTIMIDELNHRVRNMLALVSSMSRQSRDRYGTIEGFSQSLEARIQAIASAHDIVSGGLATAVSIRLIIEKELEPYLGYQQNRVVLTGPDAFLRADVAPVFSLIIHELVTNAVKYGALSTDEGLLSIFIAKDNETLSLHWTESKGPKVAPPTERGFGSTLIERAVPHELRGQAELIFAPAGVQANFTFPISIFEDTEGPGASPVSRASDASQQDAAHAVIETVTSGTALILEDNYIIAQGLAMQLEKLGFDDVEICSDVPGVMEFLETMRPVFAILDINLGNGVTSEPAAIRLEEMGVPFMFVTGYGDATDLAPNVQDAVRLTKPAPTEELVEALGKILSPPVQSSPASDS